MKTLNTTVLDKLAKAEQPQNRSLEGLFIFFAVNLVIPIIDIPVFGFSLSAVIFILIFLLIIRQKKIDLSKVRTWLYLAVWIGLAVLVSTISNGLLSGGTNINAVGINYSIHYIYWLFVFIITLYILAQRIIPIEKVLEFCSYAIFGVALLRLFEAVFWGKVGAWTNTRFLTQNTYGVLFSMFAPLAIYMFLQHRKLAFFLINLVIFSAVLINGSRGSWIALGSMLIMLLVLLVFSTPSLRNIMLVIYLGVMVLIGYLIYQNFAPTNVQEAFETRFSTLENLEYDKSYLIRTLMVQKGLTLFSESPLIGVGTARFTYETVLLDLPMHLRYGSQQHFNVKSAHNSYVAFLAEQGLLGSIPYALLIVLLAVGGFSAAARLMRKNQYWGLGVFLCFTSMSIHMWGINSLTNTANWVIYAWVASLIMLAKHEAPLQNKQ